MNLFKNMNISTKVSVGFGLILVLLMVIALVGSISLITADNNFKKYRSLARQTNAEGRVQANMLTTRLFAKNFVISANEENIKGVKERAKKTIDLIKEARELSKNSMFRLMVDDLESELSEYLAHFKSVTEKQKTRDTIVHGTLNVIGPKMEKGLTAIMESAFKDGDANAAYRAGIALRSLLLARLYAARFLVQNDTASYDRTREEFQRLELRTDELMADLENPKRRETAAAVRSDQRDYYKSFIDVYNVILARNAIIRTEMDRIGPKVADKIEKLKLNLKAEQDDLGPKAEASINKAVLITITTSAVSLILGVLAIWMLGFGVSKPVLAMAAAMKELSGGDTKVIIPNFDQQDELGDMSRSVMIFKESMAHAKESAATERAAKVEIEKARDIAEEATNAKASFLAAMSHEIRTPMNGIIGMVDLLVQTKLEKDQSNMLRTVKESAYSLLTIINDILDFSKIEAGKLNLEVVPFSFREMAEGVAETLAPSASNKNLGLHIHIDPEIPESLLGDPVRVRQLMFNLAGNAIKFTNKGEVLIRAYKKNSANKSDTAILFQIIDSGIGISETDRENLFTEFSQAEKSTTRRFGGTGLGLAICARLTELMGGKIQVESVVGKGSSFTVLLAFPTDGKNPNTEQQSSDLEGLKILLVGEDSEKCDLDASYLRHSNGQVSIITDLDLVKSIAIDAAEQEEPFNVVVLGTSWTVDARAEKLRALQSEKSLAETRFVFMTKERLLKDDFKLVNTIFVDSDPLRRWDFVRAVAIAAGRASPNIDYYQESVEKEALTAQNIEEAEAAGTLILVAEDNITNQDVIRRQLNQLGHGADIFSDGKMALEAWKSKHYALLLTDCHMPVMDGFELTKNIRESENFGVSRMPIVAISASTLEAEVMRCYSVGMDDFLAKPLETRNLKSVLKKWIPQSGRSVSSGNHKNETTSEPAETSAVLLDDGNTPIDPRALKDSFGDDDLVFKDILNDFVEPTAAIIKDINNAFSVRDAEGVGAAGHMLKSSSRSVGAHKLADICTKLEESGKSENWDSIDDAMPLLEPAFADIVNYIKSL